MTTNYGARPGLTAVWAEPIPEPGAIPERWMYRMDYTHTDSQGNVIRGALCEAHNKWGAEEIQRAFKALAELDAERERHAATLAALVGARQWLVLYDSADEDGERQLAADLNAVDRAIAQARGLRGAS